MSKSVASWKSQPSPSVAKFPLGPNCKTSTTFPACGDPTGVPLGKF